MVEHRDAEYYRSRERQERDLATVAVEADSATVHRLSAELYCELRRQTEMQSAPGRR